MANTTQRVTSPEDLCPRPANAPLGPVESLAPPIHLSSVYRCRDTGQANRVLMGEEPGYVYRRDGHPNAQMLAQRCAELHGAERAAVTSSGMSAIALAVLSQTQRGDHLVVSNRLYGASRELLTTEAERLALDSTVVDTQHLEQVEAACREQTRLIVVETISNPTLRVSDIGALAEVAHRRGAQLVVDNSFASPVLCRPLSIGADLVVESLTKIMAGHSDVLLGCLCGAVRAWGRVDTVISRFGLTSSPLDCYLALRGMGTLALRVRAASATALVAAKFLASRPEVAQVDYPGLAEHPEHDLARQQFGSCFGSIVTFSLRGGWPAAEAFIAATAEEIPFCPSLGELSTTLTHPASTSHRQVRAAELANLGIDGGTIRLSLGIESEAAILERISAALSAASPS